jgi:hypothetical protein
MQDNSVISLLSTEDFQDDDEADNVNNEEEQQGPLAPVNNKKQRILISSGAEKGENNRDEEMEDIERQALDSTLVREDDVHIDVKVSSTQIYVASASFRFLLQHLALDIRSIW